MTSFHEQLKSAVAVDTARQQAISVALRKARRLVDELGQDHPLAMLAIIDAVELGDPGFIDLAMAECGFHLPEPTRCDADGAPLFTVAQIAQTVGKPVRDVEGRVAEIEQAGVDLKRGRPAFVRQ